MMLQFTKIDWFNNEFTEKIFMNPITSCAYNEKVEDGVTQFTVK